MTTPDPARMDLGNLALFVGTRINELILDELHETGFPDIRTAHGYVFQHLIEKPRTITELANLMGVSQQAASKSVAELVELEYLEDAPSADRRARRLTLSARGLACLELARSLRLGHERRISRRYGEEATRARTLLAAILEDLGGADAVRGRAIRAPR